MEQSPYEQCKQLEGQLKRLLASQDLTVLPADIRQVVVSIKRNLADARLDIRDYEYAETGVEQQLYAAAGKKRLELVRDAVLKASEHNVFGAVDVAALSANIEQILSKLE